MSFIFLGLCPLGLIATRNFNISKKVYENSKANYATGAKRGMLPCAGKHAIVAEPGKRCNQSQAREAVQPLRNAGKLILGKHGKAYYPCLARENI